MIALCSDILISSSLCHTTETTDTLIDLAGLDTPSPPQPAALPSQTLNLISTNPTISPIPVLPPPPKHLAGSHGSQSSSPSHPPLDKASTALSLLDDELLSLGNTSLIITDGVKGTMHPTVTQIVVAAPLKLTRKHINT